jgi:hypothetical protein
MRTKQSKERARVRRVENLPPGPRGLEAILAVELPDEEMRQDKRRFVMRRMGRRPEFGDVEDFRWRALERAYLEGRLPVGVAMRLNELLALAGMKPVGDLMCLQMRLAEQRSPVRIVDDGWGCYRVEAR